MPVPAGCHPVRSARYCHNDRVRDGSIEYGTGLSGLRRYTWWAVPGTSACLLVLFVGDWLLDRDVPAWVRGSAAAALAVAVVSNVVLLGRRMTPPPGAGTVARRLATGWPIAAAAATLVLAALPLALRDYGLWALAPRCWSRPPRRTCRRAAGGC
jgi:two-component system, NarL family, sensor histidine kinase DesK